MLSRGGSGRSSRRQHGRQSRGARDQRSGVCLLRAPGSKELCFRNNCVSERAPRATEDKANENKSISTKGRCSKIRFLLHPPGLVRATRAGFCAHVALKKRALYTLHLRLPDGRLILFWVLVLVGACQSGTVWAGLCLIHHHHKKTSASRNASFTTVALLCQSAGFFCLLSLAAGRSALRIRVWWACPRRRPRCIKRVN